MATKTDLLKAIRAKCADCGGGSVVEVKLCGSGNCALWPFRFGKDVEAARRPNGGSFKTNRGTGRDGIEVSP